MTHILNDKSAPNIDDVTEPMPSTSSVPCQVLANVRSGLELLENALHGCHSSGFKLVASLFSDSVKNDSMSSPSASLYSSRIQTNKRKDKEATRRKKTSDFSLYYIIRDRIKRSRQLHVHTTSLTYGQFKTQDFPQFCHYLFW